MSTKTLLVTGGSGLVGQAIKSISNNYPNYSFVFVSSTQYDLLNLENTKQMFIDIKPDYVIHLAACVGGLFKNMNNKVEMLEKNLMINYNVVKCSHDYKIKKLIACLSTCIFPNIITYPISEDTLHSGTPHNSNDTYSYAKRMLDIQCKAYRENYNDNFSCIIPTNIYGKYDNFNIIDGHVLPALIHQCYLAKQNNTNFVIKGSGKPLRQFIYSEDLARLIMVLFEKDIKENIILSVPEKDEISIGDVGRFIAKCFDYENNVVFDTTYSDGQYKKTVSIDKLSSVINQIDFTSINIGIRETVDWFVYNFSNIRK